ncbi:DUF1513 domain-containing protein [Oceanobacter mangrovi]|uniref:DUF1513 domain-containing protein n=1 Tax=Oceanobacter mangrovi TaxID=2862510 RepID=UPI001C8E36EA|nr:DUF1513 domain-containing protein [Oceanobacter mangrovi]
MNRRQLLAGAGSTALIGSGLLALPNWVMAGQSVTDQSLDGAEVWISAQGNEETGYFASWILDGEQQPLVQSAASQFRGHGLAQNPVKPSQAVMFSRRPGTHGLVVNLYSGAVEQVFECADGHHMHGHGVYTPDGNWLLTTESDYRSGTGKLIARNTSNWAIEAEFLTHGIGPHDVRLMPDNKTLVVANGGLRTHPDSGREILNLDTMDPSLVYLSLYSGELISQHRLPESKASIRHLSVADDGTVAVATQVQRAAMTSNSLVSLGAIHRQGSEMVLLNGPDSLMNEFRDYMGSVAINNRERIAGFTSPRGNLAAFWHLDTHELLGYHAFYDVCGLTVTRDEQHFVLTNSAGEVRELKATSLREDRKLRRQYDGKHWDNHTFTLTLPKQTV